MTNQVDSNEQNNQQDSQTLNTHSDGNESSIGTDMCPWLMSPAANSCTCPDKLHERYSGPIGSGLNFLGKIISKEIGHISPICITVFLLKVKFLELLLNLNQAILMMTRLLLMELQQLSIALVKWVWSLQHVLVRTNFIKSFLSNHQRGRKNLLVLLVKKIQIQSGQIQTFFFSHFRSRVV